MRWVKPLRKVRTLFKSRVFRKPVTTTLRNKKYIELGPSNWITNFIWGIADDVLRDLYVRGKYRDVILPMTVLRRLDAELESTKQAVLDMKAALDTAEVSCRNTVPPASPPASSAGLTCALASATKGVPRRVTKHIEVQSEL